MGRDLTHVIEACERGLEEKSSRARRLFHGRGHEDREWAFLNIDWFSPMILMTLYSDPGEEFVDECVDALASLEALKGMEGLLVQRRDLSGAPGKWMRGRRPAETLAHEDGLRFQLQPGDNQNSGFFLDMAHGRQWLKERSKSKKILNLFSYTCAFSVVAVAAGALEVVNIDMNRNVLNQGRLNHQLNGLSTAKVQFYAHDIFKSWSKLKRQGPFDILIIDPPTKQHGSCVVEKDYPRLVRRIPELLSPGGDVLACLNAPHLGYSFLEELFVSECPACHPQEYLLRPPGFFETIPEKGLKVIHYQYAPQGVS